MNALYDYARQLFATGELDWTAAPIAAYVVSDAYAFDRTHQELSAIPAGALLKKAPLPLAGKSATNGVLSAAPITFGPVIGEGLAKAVVFVRDDTGALIWYGSKGFGFPFRPNGSEIVVRRDHSFGGFVQL